MFDYATIFRFLRFSLWVGLEIGIVSHNIEFAIGMAEYINEVVEARYGACYNLRIEEEYLDDMWKLYDINDKELENYVSFIIAFSSFSQAEDCVKYLLKKGLL